MSRRALIACANHWQSPIQVGDHHLARGLVKRGYEVAFVSNPLSPMHLVKRNEQIRQRFQNYRAGGERDLDGRLWSYVPGTLIAPRAMPIANNSWVLKNWPRLTLPSVVSRIQEQGFGEVDLLYLREAKQSFWLDHVKHERLVYRVADRDSGFADHTPELRAQECRIAQAADLVVYSASNLSEYVAELAPRRALHLPNGVDFRHFSGESGKQPPEYHSLRNPIVVYAGSLDVWVDFALLLELSSRMPDFEFVLIGPPSARAQALDRADNVHVLGSRPFGDLPPYLQWASVGIIPFDVENHKQLVDCVHPLKLYEYLASGIPVVATRWQELERIQSPARLCTGVSEFERALREAEAETEQQTQRRKYAQQHDWSNRLDVLLRELELEPA